MVTVVLMFLDFEIMVKAIGWNVFDLENKANFVLKGGDILGILVD